MNTLIITIFLFMPVLVVSLGVLSVISNIRSHKMLGKRYVKDIDVPEQLKLKPLTKQ